MGGRDHFQTAIFPQGTDQPIDQLWIRERLVALNIYDVSELARFRHDRGGSVRPA